MWKSFQSVRDLGIPDTSNYGGIQQMIAFWGVICAISHEANSTDLLRVFAYVYELDTHMWLGLFIILDLAGILKSSSSCLLFYFFSLKTTIPAKEVLVWLHTKAGIMIRMWGSSMTLLRYELAWSHRLTKWCRLWSFGKKEKKKKNHSHTSPCSWWLHSELGGGFLGNKDLHMTHERPKLRTVHHYH